MKQAALLACDILLLREALLNALVELGLQALQKLAAGDMLRFVCGGAHILVLVKLRDGGSGANSVIEVLLRPEVCLLF